MSITLSRVSRRARMLLPAAAVLAVAGIVAAVVAGGGGRDGLAAVPPSTTASTVKVAPSTTAAPATTVPPATLPPVTEPAPPPAEPTDHPDVVPVGVVLTPSGLLAPVVTDLGGGFYEVQTPCDNRASVAGTPLGGIDVVLDPGHGGDEPGAVGPNGLAEKDLNLAVAHQVADRLRAAGISVVLTHDIDVRYTLATRSNIAVGLGADAFLSIHHNAAPDGPSTGPGTEVYFQVADPESRRLAGLVVEEVRAALGAFPIAWESDVQNGGRARVRPSDGTDFYGVLRRTAGVPGVLSEAGYLSNPAEADLFASAEGQAAEAGAITRAVLRWYDGAVPPDGAYDPNPPSSGASGGPGGGPTGCVDPVLG